MKTTKVKVGNSIIRGTFTKPLCIPKCNLRKEGIPNGQ